MIYIINIHNLYESIKYLGDYFRYCLGASEDLLVLFLQVRDNP